MSRGREQTSGDNIGFGDISLGGMGDLKISLLDISPPIFDVNAAADI